MNSYVLCVGIPTAVAALLEQKQNESVTAKKMTERSLERRKRFDRNIVSTTYSYYTNNIRA